MWLYFEFISSWNIIRSCRANLISFHNRKILSVWMENRKCNKISLKFYDAENGKFVWDWFQIYWHRKWKANLSKIKKWESQRSNKVHRQQSNFMSFWEEICLIFHSIQFSKENVRFSYWSSVIKNISEDSRHSLAMSQLIFWTFSPSNGEKFKIPCWKLKLVTSVNRTINSLVIGKMELDMFPRYAILLVLFLEDLNFSENERWRTFLLLQLATWDTQSENGNFHHNWVGWRFLVRWVRRREGCEMNFATPIYSKILQLSCFQLRCCLSFVKCEVIKYYDFNNLFQLLHNSLLFANFAVGKCEDIWISYVLKTMKKTWINSSTFGLFQFVRWQNLQEIFSRIFFDFFVFIFSCYFEKTFIQTSKS